MNRQQVYETVRNHLITQNVKSVNNLNAGVYRGRIGRKCAIGVIIPDDLYKPEFDEVNHNADIRSIIQRFGAINVLGYEVDEQDIEFLDELQQIHDQYDPAVWASKLSQFATDWGLTPR